MSERIPPLLQFLLWELVFSIPADQSDGLQVFSLSAEEGGQKIVHTQECPSYRQEYLFSDDAPICEKVFVIDDGTCITMLLHDEY